MATHTDLVCGMQVDEQRSAGISEYKNRTYYFCSQACKQKFEASPERYAKQT